MCQAKIHYIISCQAMNQYSLDQLKNKRQCIHWDLKVYWKKADSLPVSPENLAILRSPGTAHGPGFKDSAESELTRPSRLGTATADPITRCESLDVVKITWLGWIGRVTRQLGITRPFESCQLEAYSTVRKILNPPTLSALIVICWSELSIVVHCRMLWFQKLQTPPASE